MRSWVSKAFALRSLCIGARSLLQPLVPASESESRSLSHESRRARARARVPVPVAAARVTGPLGRPPTQEKEEEEEFIRIHRIL